MYNLALSSKQFFGDVPTPNVVEAGSFCQVDGLQSEAGKKLNGQRCSVKRYVLKDKRYKVQMESSNSNDVNTFALKVTNLILLPPKLGTSNKYLASKMLRESLLVSLERVLKKFRIGYYTRVCIGIGRFTGRVCSYRWFDHSSNMSWGAMGRRCGRVLYCKSCT